MNLFSVSHGFGQVSFHVVFCPKYRYKILTGEVKSVCERVFHEVARKYNFMIHEVQVLSDHVHLFVGFRPNVCVSRVVQLFKGVSARRLFQAFPRLRTIFRRGHLWSRGKFYRSVGNVTADTIKHYIAKSQGDWSRVLRCAEEVQPPTGRYAQTSLLDYAG
ncbi:MAG: IS200/IS605 family transposase [Candidatus Altiarchaeota archaeon]